MKDLFEEKVVGGLPARPYIGSQKDRIVLHGFAASVIRSATRDIEISKNGVLIPEEQIYVIVEVLKQLTRFYVIDRPSLSSAQRGQQNVLTNLTAELWAWSYDHYTQRVDAQSADAQRVDASVSPDEARERMYRELPPRLVDYIDIACVAEVNDDLASLPEMILRGVVDYVVSLTDSQANLLHARLSGATAQSMLDPWLFF